MLFCSALSGAFLDVLVDALMVVQSKKDEEDGSETLQSLSWACMGAGGMFGSLVGGYLTEYMHPRYSFLTYSIFGLIVMLLGIKLSAKAEIDESDEKKETKSFIVQF